MALSIEQTNVVYFGAWVLTIVGAGLTLLGTLALYWSGSQRDRYSEGKIASLNARAAIAERETAGLQKDAAQLRLDLERERARNAPRALTKTQWDAFQHLREKMTAVNVAWEANTECASFGAQLVAALQDAGLKVLIYRVPAEAHWTGIIVEGNGITSEHPLVQALIKADLYGGHGVTTGSVPNAPADVPLILVGERYLQYNSPPHFGQTGARD